MIIYLISSTAVLFSIAYFILIRWLLSQWKRLQPPKEDDNTEVANTKVSILIPARNEAANIAACLDSLLLQSYPKSLFEVIVIDDHSTDNTATIVQSYANKGVRLVSLADHLAPPTQSYRPMNKSICLIGWTNHISWSDNEGFIQSKFRNSC